MAACMQGVPAVHCRQLVVGSQWGAIPISLAANRQLHSRHYPSFACSENEELSIASRHRSGFLSTSWDCRGARRFCLSRTRSAASYGRRSVVLAQEESEAQPPSASEEIRRPSLAPKPVIKPKVVPRPPPRGGKTGVASRGGSVSRGGAGRGGSVRREDSDRPGGERARPFGDRERPAGDRERPAGDRERPAGDRERPAGDRERPFRERPTGDRERPSGDRERPSFRDRMSSRPSGDGEGEGERERPARAMGSDRPERGEFDRPSRGGMGGDRPGRPSVRASAPPAVAAPPKLGDVPARPDKVNRRPAKSAGPPAKKYADKDELGGRGRMKLVKSSTVDIDNVVRAGRARRKQKQQDREDKKEKKEKVEILEVSESGMPLTGLAKHLAVNEAEVIKVLFMKGLPTTVNSVLDMATVKLVCAEFGVEVLEAGTADVSLDARKKSPRSTAADEDPDAAPRPPVVTIMGHVDHGKTSMLDYIRKAKVAAGEAGGITQGIGAYQVEVQSQPVVFLDTPGHQAFSAMRARGARVTDIVVLVVAADDGVRPQTIEAISHAKAAGVPIIVALNKMDKTGVNAERVMQELAGIGLMPEAWGGEVPMLPVSALTGDGVDVLLDTILLVSEVEDLRANPKLPARGTVLEAHLDRNLGPVASVMVQAGTLRKGDAFVSGEVCGKIRSLIDYRGASVDTATPSSAVQVCGLSGVPVAGDEFEVCPSERVARERAAEAALRLRQDRLVATGGEGRVTLASLADVGRGRDEGGSLEPRTLNVVLKVDVAGSTEAVREALQELPQDTVALRFLMAAPGDVSTSDVELAAVSDAVVLGFGVTVPAGVAATAAAKGVEIRTYDIIYRLVDDVRLAMEGLLAPKEVREALGQAEVRAVFGAGSGRVAGCMVKEGKLAKGCQCAVLRNGATVHTGKLDSLRRVKEVVKEVPAGMECGVMLEGFSDWKEGDVIDAYNLVSMRQSLEDASKSKATEIAARMAKEPAGV